MPEDVIKTTPKIAGRLLEGNKKILKKIRRVEKINKAIARTIFRIQHECPHPEPYLEDFSMPEKRERALVKRVCNECNFSLPQPKGEPWEVCIRCWSPMTHKENEPAYLYHCTKCNHPAKK